MPITHAPHMSGTAQIEAHGAERRRGSPPLLWFALIVAMFAAALLWLRTTGNDAPIAAPSTDRLLPATPAPVAEAPRAQPRAMPPSQRAVAPVRDRQAQPLSSNAKPEYPARALRNGVQGSVVASLRVGVDGRVEDATIVSRNGERNRELDRAALDTLGQWRFEPAMKDGKAVASVVRVPVDFRTVP